MTFMTWNDDLLTGIEVVDQQHRGLVDLVNTAAPILALETAVKPEILKPLFDQLFNYAAVHFKTEEDLMAASGVDARVLEHHHATHAQFVEQVGSMVAHYSHGGGVSGEQLLSFLAGWLVFHILGEDQAMARQLKAIEQGQPPEQAYAQAGGARLSPAPGALTHTLVQLYTLLSRQNYELDQHRNSLRELVQVRTAELEKRTEDLRASRDAAVAGSQAKSRFLGIMSHELRTPMNAILGFSQLLLNEPVTPKAAGLAQKVVDASRHLLDLINGIIDYASFEAGQVKQAQADFELESMLVEACRKPCALAVKKGIAVRREVDPALPALMIGDVRHLTLALHHYADNAAKFTEHGSITVKVERVRELPDQGIRVRFSVQDTGIGIDEEQQPLLFEAFSQLDDQPTRAYEGIGLGLAQVRQLAHLMSAETGVISQPGQGSCFWLELDLKKSDTARSNAGASALEEGSPGREQKLSGAEKCDVADVLNKLTQMLNDYDSRSSEVFDLNSACLSHAFGARANQLGEQIASFAFDEALNTVRTLVIEISPQAS